MKEFLGFLLGWSARSAIVAGLALVLCLLARRMPGASRNLILRCALAVTLLTPVAMLLADRFHLGYGLASTAPVTAGALSAASVSQETVAPAAISGSDFGHPASSPRSVESATPFDYSILVFALYAIGALACIARWSFSMARIRRICRSAHGESGIKGTVVAKDPALAVPVTFGTFRPVIVLPADSYGWPQERLQAALLHEQAHIKRHDWGWQTAASFLLATQWFNPALWFIVASLLATAEEAADDQVLDSGVTPSIYASELLYFASKADQDTLNSATAMARPGSLPRRLRAILRPGRSVGDLRPRQIRLAGLTLALSGLALAGYGSASHDQASNGRHATPTRVQQKQDSGAWEGTAVVAKLLFISDGRSSSMPAWDFKRNPVDVATASNHTLSYTGGASQAGKRSVGVYLRLNGLPGIDGSGTQSGLSRPSVVAHLVSAQSESSAFTGGESGASSMSSSPDGKELDVFQTFNVPEGLASGDLKVGIGSGAYQTALMWLDGTGSLAVRISPMPGSFVHTTITRDGKTTTSKDPSCEVACDIPNSILNKDWRIVAHRADGTSFPIATSTTPLKPSSKQGFSTVVGKGVATPNRLDRIALEVRDLNWVTLHDVPLYGKSSANP